MNEEKQEQKKATRKKQTLTQRRSKQRRRAFLAAFARCGSITEAARAVGISNAIHHWWCRRIPGYRERFERVEKDFCDVLVSEAKRRAYEGVEEPVFRGNKDGPVGHVRKYSDILLMFLIKKLDPSYRESYNVELTGRDRGPIRMAAEQLSDEELAKIAAGHAARSGLRIAPQTQRALPPP